jgi:hypothetical protein
MAGTSSAKTRFCPAMTGERMIIHRQTLERELAGIFASG